MIAAAVIGGTSLAGGVGTIYGALIGALVIQSLQSGMVLLGLDSAFQQMVVGLVLVGAVGIDTFYRRRTAKGCPMAKDLTVGVSWSNFQEERWKIDEAAIKKALEAHGAKYISADAQASPTKQLTDVESLISKGANVLIILAMDSEAILPAVKKAATKVFQSSPTTA